MAVGSCIAYLLALFLFCASFPHTHQLQSSQAWSLLRIQRLLNYPTVLRSWTTQTDFCNLEPNPFLTIVCYEDSITQLHITGNESSPPLPRSFSMNSFFTTLTRLPDLKVLSLASVGLWGPLPAKISRLSYLEIVNMSSNYLYGIIPHQISNLKNLQTLILDHNMFGGRIPDSLGELSLLAVLSLRNNTLSGPVPNSFSHLGSLRVLMLSSNSLVGELPDLSSLKNLQVLDLENNYLGPSFPSLGRKIETVVLRKNKFNSGLPSEVTSYYLLERFDISSNRFVGPFPPALLSLPSIQYLNIAGNRFTGMLFENMTCNNELEYVDISSNLLTGNLPACLAAESRKNAVMYAANCLGTQDHSQHPSNFCQNQALAVGILPRDESKASSHKAANIAGIVLGVIGSACIIGVAVFFALRRYRMKRATIKPPRKLIEHASSGYPNKLLTDARYISQTMRLGALGIPPYRSFSLEEIEAATNNFETSSFMGEGSHGQMYRGKLKDGSLVAIRCLKLKKSQHSQNFNRHIELISKLRHRHLVSALGHCFEYYLDDSTVSRVFLIFEYVPNGTLRNRILEGVCGQKLTWTQRISAAIGVVKGIQFLHGGIIPGLFANDLKITNVLLDQNLVAKISSYNLPVLAEDMKNEIVSGISSSGSREHNERLKYMDKIDIYDFGVILLEILSGKPIISSNVAGTMKHKLQESITADEMARRSIVDPAISKGCSDESLKTVMEICLRCLSKEPAQRPSVEDVLWNLQFAAQVQESWRGDSQSCEESPLSPSQPPRSPISQLTTP